MKTSTETFKPLSDLSEEEGLVYGKAYLNLESLVIGSPYIWGYNTEMKSMQYSFNFDEYIRNPHWYSRYYIYLPFIHQDYTIEVTTHDYGIF